ncbi:MAG: hypothetical protein ACF8TS_04950, partial [Maioricimonas sp. JB049]
MKRLQWLDAGFTAAVAMVCLLPLALLAPGTVHADDAAASTAPAETPSATPNAELTELIERVQPSIVVISFEGRDGQTKGIGTGFVIR